MNLYFYFLLLIELVVVGVYDFYTKKIPNKVIITNIVLFVFVFWIDPKKEYLLNKELFLFPGLFILIGFYLFKFDVMGAGDSKLLASVFLFIPVNIQEIYLHFLLQATLLVGISYFLLNMIGSIEKIKLAIKHKSRIYLKGIWGKKFPFAPVIILSWIWFGWNIYLKI